MLVTPLLFGVAHLHHLREHVVHQGCALLPALAMVCLVAEPQLYSLWCRNAPPTSTLHMLSLLLLRQACMHMQMLTHQPIQSAV